MGIKQGWEVSPDRTKIYNLITEIFQEGEEPILTTKMKRGATWGEGFSVLTNKNYWWIRKTSTFEKVLDGMLSALLRPSYSGQGIDTVHRPDLTVPGTTRKLFSLYNITEIEPLPKGKFILRWMRFNKNGEPKVDKNGDYKTKKETYRVLINKKEDKKLWVERRELFAKYLQEAIDDLVKDEH